MKGAVARISTTEESSMMASAAVILGEAGMMIPSVSATATMPQKFVAEVDLTVKVQGNLVIDGFVEAAAPQPTIIEQQVPVPVQTTIAPVEYKMVEVPQPIVQMPEVELVRIVEPQVAQPIEPNYFSLMSQQQYVQQQPSMQVLQMPVAAQQISNFLAPQQAQTFTRLIPQQAAAPQQIYFPQTQQFISQPTEVVAQQYTMPQFVSQAQQQQQPQLYSQQMIASPQQQQFIQPTQVIQPQQLIQPQQFMQQYLGQQQFYQGADGVFGFAPAYTATSRDQIVGRSLMEIAYNTPFNFIRSREGLRAIPNAEVNQRLINMNEFLETVAEGQYANGKQAIPTAEAETEAATKEDDPMAELRKELTEAMAKLME